MAKILKRAEKKFKQVLNQLLSQLLSQNKKNLPPLQNVRKVLLFRLDQRIGNGILLLPLLRAMRTSSETTELHFLIHHPVARLLESLADVPADRIWPYDQPVLMRRPWRYLQLLRRLRRESFDIIITANNPDNFSLSHAVFGRLCKPGCFIGFDAREGSRYFDIAVRSSVDIHYADAMIDLWRVVDPVSVCQFGGLSVRAADRQKMAAEGDMPSQSPVLIWLGATGHKVLSGEVVAYIYEQIRQQCNAPILFACGPADTERLARFPEWLRKQTIVWRRPLLETAAFFANCRAFVSGDTGPMHLAVALGIPTLTIFVDSNIRQYGYHVNDKHFSHTWLDEPESKIAVNQSIEKLCG